MTKALTWAVASFSFVLAAVACDDGEQSFGSADDCAPMDAQGVGQCDLSVGVIFTGQGCTGIAGCECAGDDCDQVFENYQACADTCLAGTTCTPDGACPDNGICRNGTCVYQ